MITPTDYPHHKTIKNSLDNMRPYKRSENEQATPYRAVHTDGDIDIHGENIQQLDNVLDSIIDA